MNKRVKLRLGQLVGIAGVLITLSGFAAGASIDISNASFETGLTGWTSSSAGTSSGLPGLTAPDGSTFVWCNPAGYVQQLNLGATVESNTTYTIEVYVGGRSDTSGHGYDLRLFSGTTEWFRDISLAGEVSALDGWTTVSTVTPALRRGDALLGGALGVLVGTTAGQTSFDLVRVTAASNVPPAILVNSSFEAREAAEGSGNSGAVPGWSGSAYQTYNPNSGGDATFPAGVASDGNMCVWMFSQTLSQVSGATLSQGTVYDLSVDMLARSGNTAPATIELRANGVLLASASGSTSDSANWTTLTTSFDADDGLPGGTSFGDPVEIVLKQTGAAGGGQGALDNVQFTVTAPGVVLSGNSVASNAVPGTLVGTLSYATTDQSGITYSLPVTATGPDSGRFQITGTTNLRTAAWITTNQYKISIAATKGGVPLATNDYTVSVTPAPGGYLAFRATAGMAASPVGGEVVGILQMSAGDSSSIGYTLTSGRTDLFSLDGSNLVQRAGSTPGPLGSVNWVAVRATNAVATSHIELIVTVSGARGTTVVIR